MVARACMSNQAGGCQAIPQVDGANKKWAFGKKAAIVVPQEERSVFDEWRTCL